MADMVPVESSNLHSIGYDPATQKMNVKFKSGGHYEYSDVPPEAHAAFMAAPSKGKHFIGTITGKYQHRKIT